MPGERAIIERARAEITTIEALRVRLGEVRDNRDVDPRRDLVAVRRAFAERLPLLRDALGDLVAAIAPDELPAFRDLHSKYRHHLALHQANWPAVRIDEDRDAYAAPASETRVTETELLRWVEALVARNRGQSS